MITIFRKMIKSYVRVLNSYPLSTQSIQTAILLGAGDIIAQRVIETNDEYYFLRTLRFTLIGAAMGPSLYICYLLLERVFEAKPPDICCRKFTKSKFNMKSLVKKVFVDQAIFAPIYYALFIACNTLLEGKGMDEIKIRFENDFTDILIANYKVWPAVQVFNFGLLPLQYRVLFSEAVSLVWNTYLAWRLNLSQIPKNEK